MKKLFKQALGDGWTLSSAGGLTGNAYIAEKNGKKLFLKRNSSPFLAVLSAEGIVPKLIWTKRIENGDVITAQEWLKGRKLRPEEMQSEKVAHMLRKIHQSSELLHMLMRLGKSPLNPTEHYHWIIEDLYQNDHFLKDQNVRLALYHLEKLLPLTRGQEQVVCHCDLNHNNLMVTEDDTLYLVDWDHAMIADPVTDFGTVLNEYVPKRRWQNWLSHYGFSSKHSYMERMYWYLISDKLQYLSWHQKRKEYHKVKECLLDLKFLNEDVQSIVLG